MFNYCTIPGTIPVMGSYIELNDTLQITTEQGFPQELDYETHCKTQFYAKDFEGRVFEFSNKPNVRIFHIPPVRVFWAHNIDGKWLYWGHVEIIELTLDYLNKTTSGKYRILNIFTPEQMQQAEFILYTLPKSRYFANRKD